MMETPQKKAKILIIDDEDIIRESFRYYLEDINYSVVCAENGSVGMELVHSESPDLILSDLRMPQMDGLEVLNRCRTEKPDTPVIVISGANRISDVVEALRSGAFDYLVKPVRELSMLRHAVEKALEGARLLKENMEYQKNLEALVLERTQELEQSREQLKDYSLHLEKTVEKRTAELQKANKELEAANKKAEAANKAKSRFLANMSHEIRTPMNGVIAAADLALEEAMSPVVKKYLDIIHASGYSLLGLINDILDFSKIEADKLDLESIPFKLMKPVTNAINLFVARAAEKKIELLTDISPDLPSELIGDPLRIQQILTNLIGNSVKFTGGNGMVKVILKPGETASRNNDFFHLKCVVMDTGIGIKPESVKKLFSPFSQADVDTTRKFGGSGLGLTISKRLVNMMGGRIHVESSYGKGALFQFDIVLKKVESRPLIDTDKEYRTMKDFNILIVGGSTAFNKTLQNQLNRFCNTFTTIAEPSAGPDQLPDRDNKPDMIIVDIPFEDSLIPDWFKKMRDGLYNNIPLIITTGSFPETEIREKLPDKSCTILSKPLYITTLLETIENLAQLPKSTVVKETSKAPVKTIAEPVNLEGKRVLVVEDNRVNQALARAILKRHGIEVAIAENGKIAIEMVEEEAYDAVLMDIQMPEMDGLEATTIIRTDLGLKSLPIIAMTANALKGDDQKCLEAGMNAYISKPVDKDKLIRLISEEIQKRLEPI